MRNSVVAIAQVFTKYDPAAVLPEDTYTPEAEIAPRLILDAETVAELAVSLQVMFTKMFAPAWYDQGGDGPGVFEEIAKDLWGIFRGGGDGSDS